MVVGTNCFFWQQHFFTLMNNFLTSLSLSLSLTFSLPLTHLSLRCAINKCHPPPSQKFFFFTSSFEICNWYQYWYQYQYRCSYFSSWFSLKVCKNWIDFAFCKLIVWLIRFCCIQIPFSLQIFFLATLQIVSKYRNLRELRDLNL